MDEEAVKVLLVEDDEDDYVLIRDLLAGTPDSKYVVEWVPTYDGAMERIVQGDHHVCLLDYRLGSGSGLDILRKAVEGGCRSCIILVTGWGDYAVDLDAMRSGAMDDLVKSQLSGPLLDRSIRYALERLRVGGLAQDVCFLREGRTREGQDEGGEMGGPRSSFSREK